MDILALNPRDRRTLIAGITAIGGLLTLSRGLPALRRWEATRKDEASALAFELSRLNSGLLILPRLRDSLSARRLRLRELDSTMVDGDSGPAVAAELGALVSQIADVNAVKVNSLQLHGDSIGKAGLIRADVRLVGVSDIHGLAGFIRSVEGSATPLRVRELGISQAEPAAPDTKPEALRVDVVVETLGLLREAKR